MTLHNYPIRYAVSCALVAFSLTGVTSAANFELSRYLEFGSTVTDNATLANTDNQSELVFSVKPSVQLKFSGNRFGAVAIGELEYFRYNEANDDVIDPRLISRIKGTLVDNLLYLDTSLVVSKLSPDRNFVRITDDDSTAAIFKSKLFLDTSFGRTADLFAAYRYSTLVDSSGDEFDSDQNSVEFDLGRDPRYSRFIWGLGGFYSRDESSQNEFENSVISASLGASITNTVLIEFTHGEEDRKLTTGINTPNPIISEDNSSSLWRAEVNWSPSELTKLTVGYGERFFGAGPNMQFRHRIRNSRILASYTRDVTRQAASLDTISSLSNNPALNPAIVNTDTVTIDNATVVTPLEEPYIDNRFRLAYKLAGRRSDVIIDAVYSDQERITGSDTIKSFLARLVFDRRLSERLSLRLQYDYQKSDADIRPDLNYKENRFAIKLLYNFDGIDRTDEDEFE
ncbi:hypothetical protein AB833_20545 [Chromatiales bacterium (ex Bugula neritina AB1)]|nr:hypothetical protein AB833_20545 [Chromatiales bacterium (ex Bugula neritina AB1)]